MSKEGRVKNDIKKHVVELGTNAKLNFSNYLIRRDRIGSGVGWGKMYGGIDVSVIVRHKLQTCTRWLML